MKVLILIGFLAYIIIGSILPVMAKVDITEETKTKTREKEFISDSVGPDRASVIADPAESLNIRIEMIQSAKDSIDIIMYKIIDSESTRAFFGEVLEAADRGVKINVLVNGLTYLAYRNQSYMMAVSTHENITGRIYNPINLLRPSRLQILMHDKLILVDDDYLLLGGRNIDERHFRPNGYKKPFAYDLEIFVVKSRKASSKNSVIEEAKEYIEKLYAYKLTKIVKEKDKKQYIQKIKKTYVNYPKSNPQFYQKSLKDFIDDTVPTNKITLIHNPIDAERKEPILGYQLKHLALKANKSVIVQTPYITGNKELMKGLQEVAEQVELTIQTNSSASTPNLYAFSNYIGHRKKINQTGASIYEFQSYDSVHNKSIIIDDRISIIGTFNMDDRSLYINSEIMLVVDSEELTKRFTQEVIKFRKQSLKLGKDNKYISAETIEALPVSFMKRFLIRVHFILLRGVQFLL